MLVCIIYPTFVTPWFLRSVYASKCSMYSCILTYSHMWSTTEQQRQSKTLCCENHQWRQVCALRVNVQTHGINRSSLLRHWQWSCSCPATCHTPVWLRNDPSMMGCRTVLLIYSVLWRQCSYRHRQTLSLLHQCLRVICWCRAVQTNSTERLLALLAM